MGFSKNNINSSLYSEETKQSSALTSVSGSERGLQARGPLTVPEEGNSSVHLSNSAGLLLSELIGSRLNVIA